jgi:hypothetical protein
MRSELERYYRRRRFLRSPNETYYEVECTPFRPGEGYAGSWSSSRSGHDTYFDTGVPYRTPGEAFFQTRS